MCVVTEGNILFRWLEKQKLSQIIIISLPYISSRKNLQVIGLSHLSGVRWLDWTVSLHNCPLQLLQFQQSLEFFIFFLEWEKGLLLPLNDNRFECDNWRDVWLLSVVTRIMTTIILERITTISKAWPTWSRLDPVLNLSVLTTFTPFVSFVAVLNVKRVQGGIKTSASALPLS